MQTHFYNVFFTNTHLYKESSLEHRSDFIKEKFQFDLRARKVPNEFHSFNQKTFGMCKS